VARRRAPCRHGGVGVAAATQPARRRRRGRCNPAIAAASAWPCVLAAVGRHARRPPLRGTTAPPPPLSAGRWRRGTHVAGPTAPRPAGCGVRIRTRRGAGDDSRAVQAASAAPGRDPVQWRSGGGAPRGRSRLSGPASAPEPAQTIGGGPPAARGTTAPPPRCTPERPPAPAARWRRTVQPGARRGVASPLRRPPDRGRCPRPSPPGRTSRSSPPPPRSHRPRSDLRGDAPARAPRTLSLALGSSVAECGGRERAGCAARRAGAVRAVRPPERAAPSPRAPARRRRARRRPSAAVPSDAAPRTSRHRPARR